MSHPMRVRGLKPPIKEKTWQLKASHPMRVRGLKRRNYAQQLREEKVAPHAGAWIETDYIKANLAEIGCRTPCGCVD